MVDQVINLLRFGLLVSTLFAAHGCARHSSTSHQVMTISNIIKTNSIGLKMVHIPGGTFQMGDGRFEDAFPIHAVTVSSFWMGQYPVTNAQFDLFKKRPRHPDSLDDNQPVIFVSWAEATAYCEWLSKRDKRRYRLPTEAEWEYAARGGLERMDYPWGNESVRGRACFNQVTTCPVGQFAPNGFGLYDMVGNGGQWVSDWYDEHYYEKSPEVDPQGPLEPLPDQRWHIIRGGEYPYFEFKCAEREPWVDEVEPVSGFRVVMDGTISAFDKSSGAKND